MLVLAACGGDDDPKTEPEPTNAAPTADAGEGRTVASGNLVTLDGSGSSDPENGQLSYSWSQVDGEPGVELANASGSAPTFTAPIVAEDVTLTFRLTVTDPGGLSGTADVSIVIEAPDAVVTSSDNLVIAGLDERDPGDGSFTYSWTQVGDGPKVVIDDSGNPNLEIDATFAEDTILTFELTVVDADGVRSTRTVRVFVAGVGSSNALPTASASSSARAPVNPGTEVTLEGSGNDPQNAPLTYSWSQTGGEPEVTLSDDEVAAPTLTAPAVTETTTLTFELTVTAVSGLTATAQVTVTVNAPPVADAGVDASVVPGSLVILDGSRSRDPQGEPLTYSWGQTGGEPAATLNDDGVVAPTFIVPAVTATTVLTFELTVTAASGLTATDQVAITVNTPPVADAGDDATATVGDVVTLDGSRSRDPQNRTITHSWRQVAGTPTVTLNGADGAAPTFTAPAITDTTNIRAGTLTFELTVTNADGIAAQDLVTVRVGGAAESFAMAGHAAAVRGVSISRDGGLAVSGGIDGTVRLWNAGTGAAIRTLGEHDGAVHAVAINADGTHAISGGADGTVRLWTWTEAADGTVSGSEVTYDDGDGGTRSLGGAGIWVYAVALNADGSRAASGGFDGKVRVWNTATTGDNAGGEITYDDDATEDVEEDSLGSHGAHSVYGVSLADDGRLALSGGADGTVRLWNVGNGEEIHALAAADGPTGVVFGVSLSGDGRLAAAGSADNHVHVWNAATGDETHELEGHATDVSSVSLNEAGTRVLSAGADGTVRLWNVDGNDAADGTELRVLRQHANYAWSAALSGDGIVALSGDGDGAMHLWNTTAQPQDATQPFATTEPDRDPQATDDVRVRVLDRSGFVSSVTLSADGRFALSAGTEGSDNAVRLWNAVTGARIGGAMTGHTASVASVSLSADGRLALSGSWDDTVRLWDAATGAQIGEPMDAHTDWVNRVKLSADGRLALSGSRDDTVRLWEAATGTQIGDPLRGHGDQVHGVSLSADGRLAVSGGWDDTVRFWNATTGDQIGDPLRGHGDQVHGVSLSADGRLALSGGGDGTVRRWDAVAGTPIGDPMRGHEGDVYDVMLSADGRLALSGGGDDVVRLWDAATGEQLRVLRGHAGDVHGVSLSADGRLALSGGRDGTARLWSFGRSNDTVVPGTNDANAGANQSVASNQVVTLDGSASTDSRTTSGKPIAYFWRQTAPSGTALSAADTVVLSANNTETVTFTAPAAPTSPTLEFALTVTDARGLVDTDTMTVSVLVAQAGDDQDVEVRDVVTLTGLGRDPSGGTPTYSWTQTGGEPTVTLDGADTATATFTAPLLTQNTTFTFQLAVTDGSGLTATDTVTVAVSASPTARAGDDRTADAGDSVTLAGSGTDPGGVTLGYSWAQTSGTPTVPLDGADTATATFTMPTITDTTDIRAGTLVFVLTVTNANGLTARDSVVVRAAGAAELFAMQGHDTAVRGISISRAGHLAVSGGIDGTVRLWNASTGAAIRTLGEHDGAVVAVAINADGTRAVSGGLDGTVRLWTWDETGGEEVRYPIGDGSDTRSLGEAGLWVYAVALNKDGSRAASGGFDGKVRVWNTDATDTTDDEDGVYGEEITYDDRATPETEANSLGGHGQHSVYGVSLSDDGTHVLSGGADGAVRLWNADTGEEVHSLTDDDGPMGVVFGVSLSGDGRLAAAGSADNHVHVWDAGTGAETHELEGHATDVSSVSLNEAGTRVLSSGADGTVRLWNVDGSDAADGTELHILRQHANYAWSAALSGDGIVALSGDGDGAMRLWNTTAQPQDTTQPFAATEPDRGPGATGDVRVRILDDSGSVSSVTLSADGRFALSAGTEGSGADAVRLWNAATGAAIGDAMTGHAGFIADVSLSADGRLVLSGSWDDTVRLWDAATGSQIGEPMTGHANWVNRVSLSADGRLALSGSRDDTVRLWDAATGTPIGDALRGHGSQVHGVSLSADGRLALSGGWDDTVRLWDATTGSQIGEPMTGHVGTVNSVSLSADGGLALSGGGDDTVRRWNPATGSQIGEPMTGHAGTVNDVMLSADGRLALSGSDDDTVRLWDAATGEHLRTLRGHVDGIRSVSLSADGRLALSGSWDGTARLWSFGRSNDTVVPGTSDANAGANQSVASNRVVTLDGSASTDSRTTGGKPIAYFWRQTAPSGTVLSAADTVALSANNTETATFTAPAAPTSPTLEFALTVTDARGLVDTDTTTVSVLVAGAGDDQAVDVTNVVTLTGSGRDPSGGTPTYSWRQTGGEPALTLAGDDTATATFTTPQLTQDTTFTFELTVTDASGLTATDTVTVAVNATPTARAGDDQVVAEGVVVTLTGSGTDPGGVELTAFSWRQTGGEPTVTLAGDDTATATFTAPGIANATDIRAGTLTFALTVTNANNLSAQDSMTVRVAGGPELFTMTGHGAAVRGVSISRDGSRAVSGGLDGTVRLWNASTGAAIRTLGSHDGAVVAVAINADGTRAVSGGLDGTVRLWTWDDNSGSEVTYDDGAGGTRSLGDRGIWVYAVALNKDGSRAASGGFDGKVRVWNTDAADATDDDDGVYGEEITYDNPLTQGTERNSLGSHGQHSVYGVSLSDDGSRVLSGGADGSVRLWNAATGEQIRALTDGDGPMGVVFGVSLSGDGRWAAAGAADNHVHVWNAGTGAETHELEGHATDVSGVSLNQAGTRVLSSGADGSVRLWNVDGDDAADGTEIHALRQHTDYAWSAALSGDGIVALSAGGDNIMHLWNTTTQPADTTQPFATTERDRDPADVGDVRVRALSQTGLFADGSVWGVSLSTDGRRALTGSLSNMVRWDTATGAQIGESMTGHGDLVTSISLSADGSRALSGSWDDTVRYWNADVGTQIGEPMTGHADWVRGVSLSADGRWALSGGGDNTVRLWDPATGENLHTMPGHALPVSGVSLSADGRLALSGSWDETVRRWDATTGAAIGEPMTGHTDPVGDVSLSADGRLALSGGEDGTVRRWNTATGAQIGGAMRGHAGDVYGVSLSANGRLALSGGGDNTVRLWDAATGEHLRTLRGHADEVRSVSLNADGRLALSGSIDGNPRLWSLGRSDDTVLSSGSRANAGADQSVASNQVVTLDGSGSTDSGTTGGKPVAYFWRQTAPAGTVLSAADVVVLSANNAETVTFTAPAAPTNPTLEFALTVTDSHGFVDTDTVTVGVLAARAGNNQIVDAGNAVTLAGSGVDPDGGSLTYSWTQPGGAPTVVLDGAATDTATFTMPTVAGIRDGVLTFTFTITNANGLASRDSVTVRADGAGLLTMEGHGATVRGVSISRDGSLAVSGGLDGTVRLWNASTGAAIRTLGEHDGAVVTVAINADGTRAVSGGLDGTVRLWTWTETGGEEVRYPIGDGSDTRSLGEAGLWVYAVSLNKDGSRAASGGFDGKVRVWNTDATDATDDEDGVYGEEITYDDAATPEIEANSLGGHGQHSVYGVSLSDDGGRVLSGGADGAVRLWNVNTGEEVRSLTDDDGPTGAVFGVSLSGDGGIAAAGSADNHVHVWDAGTGAETHELEGHATDVSSVSLNEAGTRVLSSGADGTVRLWNVDGSDAADGTELRVLRQHADYAWSASLSGDGIVALSGGGDNIMHLWNTDAQLAATTQPFATTERDRNPRITGDVRSRVLRHPDRVYGASLSGDGRLALTGGVDGTVRRWNAATGAAIGGPLTGHANAVLGVALSADGRLALSGGADDTVRRWNAATGAAIGEPMTGHGDDVRDVALSADSRLALSGGVDDIVRRWDAATGAAIGEPMTGHGGDVHGVALSADGRLALSGGADDAVRRWDAATGAAIGEPMTGHGGDVHGVALSATGRLALSGSADDTVRLWDAATGEHLRTMTGHGDDVHGVALSADGRLALSGSADDTVRLWDAATGEHLRTMTGHGDDVRGVALSADGRLALSGGFGRTARLWSLGRSDDTAVSATARANAGADDAVAAAAVVTLDGTGSTDSRETGGKPVAYYWRQVAPEGTTLSAADIVALSPDNAETATFTAPATPSGATLRFALTVTDARGLVDTDGVTIAVAAAEVVPPPTVTGVRIVPKERGRGADDTHGWADTIAVEVTFSGPVTVTGNPRLALVIGTQTRQADYFAGSGSATLTFHYVVREDDVDADGIGIEAGALQLNGGLILAANRNAANLDLGSHAIAGDANHKVDGRAGLTAVLTTPELRGVGITSRPQQQDTYGATEVIVVRVHFSSSVTVAGNPTLTLTIGSQTRTAVYVDGSGTATLIFRYTVQASDTDTDGIGIAADALSLNGGSVTGQDGSAVALNLAAFAIATAADHKVDGSVDRVAAVTRLIIVSRPQSGDAYGLGETIRAWVGFSEAVTITGSGGPTLRFDIGTESPVVADAGRGSRWLRFDYAVQSGDTDADGISIAADALQLGGATIADAGGQAANLDLTALAIANASGHRVDAAVDTAPTADAGDDQRGRAGTVVTLDGSGSSDAQTSAANLTYAWEKLCGPEVTLAGADTASPTFTAATVLLDANAPASIPPLPPGVDPFHVYTTLSFLLTVTDEQGNRDADVVTVTVAPADTPDAPPTLEAAALLEGRCETPGDEKNWLRSWSNENYFWYDEIVDQDPTGDHGVGTYFDLMKTFAEAQSCGKPKDDFHFLETEAGAAAIGTVRTNGRRTDFGAIFGVSNDSQLFVKYVHPGSPLALAPLTNADGAAVATGLRRGDEITRIGTTAINGATLAPGSPGRVVVEAAIQESRPGVTLLLEIARNGDRAAPLTASVTTGTYVADPVPRYDVIDTDTGRVGYLLFVDHSEIAEAELIEAMSFFEQGGVADLVLDLRYNQGGLLAIATGLATMIANPAATSGQIYEHLVYNDKKTVAPEDTNYFEASRKYSQPIGDTDLPNLGLNRLFVITSPSTCSASESIINSLRGVDIEVVQIGAATCGKPYGTTPVPNCGKVYFSTQFVAVNAEGFGDYQYGFAPENAPASPGNDPVRNAGCHAPFDDHTHPLGDAEEGMLATALTYRGTNGSCTVPTAGSRAHSETIARDRPAGAGRIVER